jgi:iron complex outermembrane receptor protein
MGAFLWPGLLPGLLILVDAAPLERLAPVDAPLPTLESASPVAQEPTSDVTFIDVPPTNADVKEVSDYVAQAPGVVVHDSGGLGQAKQLSFRGSSANGVLVLVDGIPLNGAGGIADLSLIPSAALARVEVLRGAGSLFGTGALGGVVNLVTRSPGSGFHLFAEGTYGSFGTELAQVSASGSVPGGSALVLLNGLHTNGDFTYQYNPKYPLPAPPLTFTRQNNDAKLGEALVKYEVSAEGWTGRLTLEGASDDRGLAGSVVSPSANDRQRAQRLAAGLSVGRTLEWGTTVQGRAFFRREADQFTGQDFPGGFDQVYLSGGGEVTATQLVGRHGLSLGLSGGGDALTTSTQSHPSWGKGAVYAQDEVLFFDGQAGLVPALRVDKVGPFWGVSPKLGGRVSLPKGFELRGNIGEGFRAPSFLELYVREGPLLPNPNLKPETTWSYDLTAAHHTSRTDLALGGFYNVSENLILYESYPPSHALPVNFAVASETGLEAEGHARPVAFVSVDAKYTLLFSKDLKDYPGYYGKELPLHPRHTAWGRVAAGPTWLHGQVELVYQSMQFTSLSNLSQPIPSYLMLNVGLCGEVPGVKGLSLAIEVRNVLNAQVEDVALYPLPGRAVYGTLRFSLDRPSHSESNMSNNEGKHG